MSCALLADELAIEEIGEGGELSVVAGQLGGRGLLGCGGHVGAQSHVLVIHHQD